MCLLDKAKFERTKARNDGGPLEQPKQMISADSPTAVQVANLISPTPQPKVLALIWQCGIWLHVAYGVYLVMLLIRVNCICLFNTLYL